MSITHFYRRRISFMTTLRDAQSALTTARYVRLILMSFTLMIWTLVASIMQIWFSTRDGIRPWTGWNDVHSDWLTIGLFPTILIPPSARVWTEVLWWITPVSALLFSAFFLFGEDAIKEYKTCYAWIRSHLLRDDAQRRSKREHIRIEYV